MSGGQPDDFAWEPDEPERRREHNARLGWFLNLLSGVVRSASEPVGASPDGPAWPNGTGLELWLNAFVSGSLPDGGRVFPGRVNVSRARHEARPRLADADKRICRE
jgi:hypothetical protein